MQRSLPVGLGPSGEGQLPAIQVLDLEPSAGIGADQVQFEGRAGLGATKIGNDLTYKAIVRFGSASPAIQFIAYEQLRTRSALEVPLASPPNRLGPVRILALIRGYIHTREDRPNCWPRQAKSGG